MKKGTPKARPPKRPRFWVGPGEWHKWKNGANVACGPCPQCMIEACPNCELAAATSRVADLEAELERIGGEQTLWFQREDDIKETEREACARLIEARMDALPATPRGQMLRYAYRMLAKAIRERGKA